MAYIQEQDLEAFCATCPSAEEVTNVLQALGFALTFHMNAVPPACAEVPPLPAQYHYRDQHVMYNQKSTPFDPFGETASRAGSAV
jgi:hypothetical protein